MKYFNIAYIYVGSIIIKIICLKIYMIYNILQKFTSRKMCFIYLKNYFSDSFIKYLINRHKGIFI